MYEVAVLRSSLDIENPLFVLANPAKNILNILKERFEKKCHKYPEDSETGSFYVEEVLAILSHTEPQISQLGSSVACTINNVEFKVSAIRCLPDEVINGCIVGSGVTSDKTIMLMRKPCMHIRVKAGDDARLIGEGKYISVLVNKAIHKYGKSLIVINGTPLFASIKTPAFKVNSDDFSSNDARALGEIYNEKFKNEVEELDAIKESTDDYERRTRLRNHLYGCKDFNRRKEVPKGIKVLNIKDLMNQSKIKSGWYFRSITRDMDSEDVFFCENESDIPGGVEKEVRIRPRDAFSVLMRHYYQGMVILREWTFIYKGDMEKSHGNLWRILNSNKI